MERVKGRHAMKFDKERLKTACAIGGQERPWVVRIDDSGFVSIVDANGMLVADFARGSPDEAQLTAEATNLLPAALARIEELERLAREACDYWEAWMTAEGHGPQPARDRLAEIRAAVEGGGE